MRGRLLVRGRILTLDPARPDASSVLIENGVVVDLDIDGDLDAEVISLDDTQSLQPGYLDDHVHLLATAAARMSIDVSAVDSIDQLLAIVGELSPRPLDLALAYRLGCSIVGQVMYLRFTSRMNALFLPESMGEKHFQNEQIAEHVYQFSLAAIRSDSFWNSLPDTPGTTPVVPATKAAE